MWEYLTWKDFTVKDLDLWNVQLEDLTLVPSFYDFDLKKKKKMWNIAQPRLRVFSISSLDRQTRMLLLFTALY